MRYLFPLLLLFTAAGPAAVRAQASAGGAAHPPLDRAVSALRAELQGLFRVPSRSTAQFGALVVSLDCGDTLFALNPDLPLAPASNVKLYSTAAALYYLGPQFRFSTYLLADGDVRDGVLHGDLILFGTGDPTLSRRMLPSATAAWEALADSLRALGIGEVRGDVIGDGTFFDNARIGAAWEDDDRMAWYAAPVDAIGVAENMVTLRVLPGVRAGEPARVETDPAADELPLTNHVRTVSRGATAVRVEHDSRGLILHGQIRQGEAAVVRRVPVVDPEQFAAATLRVVLEQRGIRVAGDAATAPDSASAWSAFGTVFLHPGGRTAPRVLAVHRSPPLADIARVTNHVSHNLFAEALFKTVGRVVAGEGSFAGGDRAVERMLYRAGVDTAAVRLVDGSGLSRPNRTTAHATVQLLDWMSRGDVWEPFRASLPVAAAPDGLRRMQGTAAAGNLQAKTGTIRGVSALSGYVTTADGERLAFSIIANGVPSTARAKQTENTVGARLAAFRRIP